MTDEMEQRSADWFAIRCGRVTASRVSDVIAKTKSGYSTSRANYAAQIVCERLTGAVEQGFTSAAMQHGVDKEPEARAAYAFQNAVTVEEVGFVLHPAIMASGASPDGLVGLEGMLEIKCPNSATHINTLLNDTVPDKYIVQMQWQMACAERQWCDFVSYDPRLPLDMQTYTRRIPRDNTRIAELEAEVRAFLADIEQTVDKLKARYGAEVPWTPSVLDAG